MNLSVNHQHVQEAIANRLDNIHAALQSSGFTFDRQFIADHFGGKAVPALSSDHQSILSQTAQSYDLMLSYALSHNGQSSSLSVSEGLSALAANTQNHDEQSKLHQLAEIFTTQAENLANGRPISFNVANTHQLGDNTIKQTLTTASEATSKTARARASASEFDWSTMSLPSREKVDALLDTMLPQQRLPKTQNRIVPTVEQLQRSLMHSVSEQIRQHNTLTENIRKLREQIESHPGIQNALKNLRKYDKPSSMLEARMKSEAGLRLSQLMTEGQLTGNARLYSTNVQELAELQRRMLNAETGQQYLKQHSPALKSDAEILQTLLDRQSGIKAFEVTHKGKRIDDQLAENARLLAVEDQRDTMKTYARPGKRMR